MLEIGTKAPEFSLPDQNGEMRSLSDYRGQKVILFHRNLTPALLAYDGIQYTYMAPAVFEDGIWNMLERNRELLERIGISRTVGEG